jgi:hypothetical protein
VAWAEPSDRVMMPNVPVMPAAVTGPFTGGQFCAHVPLHFDVVGVSGANEYSVKPALLVSTVTPPIFAVVTAPAAAAAGVLVLLTLLADEAGEEVADELHAARTATAATAASNTPQAGNGAGELRRKTAAAGIGNPSCCHDLLSFCVGAY